MNNENQNNQNSNVESLNSTSLGTIENPQPTVVNTGVQTEPVNPSLNNGGVNPIPTPVAEESLNDPVNPTLATNITPETNVANQNPVNTANTNTTNNNLENGSMNYEPYPQPIPGTMSYSANTNVNSNSNGFVEAKKVENMGVEVPQNSNNGNKKKPMNKVLFIILIVVLLGAIAYGVYYYLSLGKTASGKKSNIDVKTNNLELPINTPLSTNINDYATISGTDSKNCNLITTNVNINKEGTYEYSITCNDGVTHRGNVTIINNNVPTATAKEVFASLNETREFKAEDFIVEDSCSEEECTYAFAQADTNISSYLLAVGQYEINISVTSASGKQGIVTSKLIVLQTPIKLYLSCTNDTTTDFIAMGANEESGNGYQYINYAYRLYTFKFDTLEEYNTVAVNKDSVLTYNNITGTATYDDANYTITIKADLPKETLDMESGNNAFPTNYSEIGTYYTSKGYTCRPIVAS